MSESVTKLETRLYDALKSLLCQFYADGITASGELGANGALNEYNRKYGSHDVVLAPPRREAVKQKTLIPSDAGYSQRVVQGLVALFGARAIILEGKKALKDLPDIPDTAKYLLAAGFAFSACGLLTIVFGTGELREEAFKVLARIVDD